MAGTLKIGTGFTFLLLLLTVGLSPEALALPETGEWTCIAEGPFLRHHATVLAEELELMICFGGWNDTSETYFDYTFWYHPDTDNWSDELDPSGDIPTPRHSPTSVWDPVGMAMVVFGGHNHNLDPGGLDDLHIFDPSDTSWALIAPGDSVPEGRCYASGVYDPDDHALVMYGGLQHEPHVVLDDLWLLDLQDLTWSRLQASVSDSGGPPYGRYAHAAVIDPESDMMYVLGGADDVVYGNNDLWALDLETLDWELITPVLPISPGRMQHSAVFDPLTDLIWVYGGYDGTGWLEDLWVYSLNENSWEEVTQEGCLPGPKSAHGGVLDPARRSMIIYSEHSGAALGLETPTAEDYYWDIKPGSCPNPLNPRSRGVLPTALLGTADLDVRDIDAGTILLEGIVSPLRSNFEDVGTPVAGGDTCECTDEGPDGFDDLTLKFRTPEVVEAIGEVSPGDMVPITVSGNLRDGTPFEATDCVRIVGRRLPREDADPALAGRPCINIERVDPNPFAEEAHIVYTVHEEVRVKLTVHDVRGRAVRELVDQLQSPGEYSALIKAAGLESGVYYYRVEADSFQETRKLVIAR